MSRRVVKITIGPKGEILVNNAGNADEARILKELSELAQLLSGDPLAVKIEKHVHSHGTAHEHTHEHTEVGAGG